MSAETMPDEARHHIDRLAREKEAERARADAAEARIVELEAVEKTLRWSVSDSEASLAAAEQRAADALARAEKAEGEIAEAEQLERRLLKQAKLSGQKADALAHSHAMSLFGIIRIKLDADRAYREAQPATDGGDNG